MIKIGLHIFRELIGTFQVTQCKAWMTVFMIMPKCYNLGLAFCRKSGQSTELDRIIGFIMSPISWKSVGRIAFGSSVCVCFAKFDFF